MCDLPINDGSRCMLSRVMCVESVYSAAREWGQEHGARFRFSLAEADGCTLSANRLQKALWQNSTRLFVHMYTRHDSTLTYSCARVHSGPRHRTCTS